MSINGEARSVIPWFNATEQMLHDVLQVIPYESAHEEVWSPRLVTVILGYCTFTTSFVTLVVGASLHNLDPSLEEAARDLYASPIGVFFRVTFPLIAPGVIAGALFAFTLAFDEYVIAFLNSGTQETIPLVIMGMMKYGLSPKINALAALIYAASFLLAVAASTVLLRRAKLQRTAPTA